MRGGVGAAQRSLVGAVWPCRSGMSDDLAEQQSSHHSRRTSPYFRHFFRH